MNASLKIFLALACDNAENCNKCADKYDKVPCNIHRQLYKTSLREYMKNKEYKDFKENLRRV